MQVHIVSGGIPLWALVDALQDQDKRTKISKKEARIEEGAYIAKKKKSATNGHSD